MLGHLSIRFTFHPFLFRTFILGHSSFTFYLSSFFQNIYLKKDGTSQLGITLGYDTKSANGQLVVCDVSGKYS